MIKTRIIPSLLLSGGSIVKTTQFDNPRIVGDPVSTINVFANRLADELCIIDIGPKENLNFDQISILASQANMPLTIGGKIKSLEIAEKLYELGTDKLLIRSLFYDDLKIINQITKKFGSQSVVFSLDYIEIDNEKICIFGNKNNKRYGNLVETLKYIKDLEIAEIFLNCITRDGMMRGFDLDGINQAVDALHVPIIASGGCGSCNHALQAIKAGASAIAAGSLFYWVGESIITLKEFLKSNKIPVRTK